MSARLILLVEDNPDDEMLALRALRKSSVEYDVVVARDGEQALHYLLDPGALSQRPAVVLLDLKLPKLDGAQVIEQLRRTEHGKTIPVVVLTSSKEENDVYKCYQLGANSYLRKPVDYTEFVELVRLFNEYWLHANVTMLN